MDIVIHRVNTVAGLRQLPRELGAEIDLRADGSAIVLNHDPFRGGERFDDWIDEYAHGLLVLNIKEAGIEDDVLRKVSARAIPRYFLLDVEFPYIYRATRAGQRAIAIRYSEDEPMELVHRYRHRADWVWIDTNTRLPLDAQAVEQLQGLKTRLVCPERWGRPGDIGAYQAQMDALGFSPDAVMTAHSFASRWQAWSRRESST